MSVALQDHQPLVAFDQAGLGIRLRSRGHRPARLYPAACAGAVTVFALVLVALVVAVGVESSQAWAHDGLSFLWSGTWNPAANRYGAGLLVVGTLVTTAAAMVIAVPIGVGLAVFLAELGPRWITGPLGAAIELLAAVPSIVVGLWALLVLSPVFASHVEPALHGVPVLGSIFTGPALGPSVLLAAVVLAVMTVPTVVALSRNALVGVPETDREAALALGATRWEVVARAVIPAARRGIAAAITLAVGRALGESIAVAMVIGNRPDIPHSLLAPSATIGSAIVNTFSEATPGLGTSSVVALAVVLLALTVAVNAVGTALQHAGRRRRESPGPPPLAPAGPAPLAQAGVVRAAPVPEPLVSVAAAAGAPVAEASGAPPVAAAERPFDVTGRLGRRRWRGWTMAAATWTCALLGAATLVALVSFTALRGAGALSLGLLTHAPAPAGVPGGGISTALVGTAEILALALAGAVPVGLLAALYLYERDGRVAAALRFGTEVLTGVPSIVIGIVTYALIVVPTGHASTLAAAFALGVLMVPIMIRGGEEALRSVPTDLWEAGVALGASRSRVARRIVVREASARLVSANLLAAARAVGETAPLLFTVAAPTAAMTLLIFDYGFQPFAAEQQQAWATALVLLAAVLAISATARLLAWRLTRNQR